VRERIRRGVAEAGSIPPVEAGRETGGGPDDCRANIRGSLRLFRSTNARTNYASVGKGNLASFAVCFLDSGTLTTESMGAPCA
jgi:hypothetical protein